MSNQPPTLWERAEVVPGQRAPALFDALRPGATALLLQQAETLLQIRLPEDLKQFFACYNGVQ